jgi:hypothetical protein
MGQAKTRVVPTLPSFVDDVQDIAMAALGGVGNDDPAQAGRLRDEEAAGAHRRVHLAQFCRGWLRGGDRWAGDPIPVSVGLLSVKLLVLLGKTVNAGGNVGGSPESGCPVW